MDKSNSSTKKHFAARILCFDLTAPNNPEEIETTVDALTKSLTLAKTFPSCMKLALLGMIVIREKPSVIYGLQDWRAHLDQLMEACDTIKKLGEEDHSNEAFTDISLIDVLDSAVFEFQRKEKCISSASSVESVVGLEIDIFSLKNLKSQSKSFLQHIITKKYGEIIKKVQLYTLKPSSSKRCRRILKSRFDFLSLDFDSSSHDGMDSLQAAEDEFTNIDELSISVEERTTSTIFEYFDVINESVILNSLFLNWMQEPVRTKEHLKLIIDEKGSLELKFDIRTRYLPSNETEFTKYFSLISAFQQTTNFKKGNLVSNSEVVTFCLEILERVHEDGICSSLINSESVVLVPTCATNYDWSELEENAFLIKETATLLRNSEDCFLAKLLEVRTEKQLQSHNIPHGLFILKPAGNVFLAFGITSRELFLIDNLNNSQFNDSCLDSKWKIFRNAILKVPFKDLYNPLEHSSNIFQHLNKNAQTLKGGGKMKNKNKQKKSIPNFVSASKLIPRVSYAPHVYE